MGSVGDQSPWAPYNTYKDCSQAICSIYCPQFCYFIFPPPPPDDNSATTPFSPLIIAIIGILASAFLLVSYYTIVTRYCHRTSQSPTGLETDEGIAHEQFLVASNGLDEAVIKTIAVCRYEKGDGLIEGRECAVCLSEFQENELLRLLPKCSHAFHLPCIDTWLRSHSNCPLCRANVVALAHPLPSSSQASSPVLEMDSYEAQRPNDLILVVDDHDQESDCRAEDQVVLRLGNDADPTPKSPIRGPFQDHDGDEEVTETRSGNVGSDDDDDQEGVKQFRRSVSLGAFPIQRRLLISDVLKIEEDRLRSCAAMKRSFSTGGFVLSSHCQ